MRVGVYGFGRMGKNHARVYKELGHDVFIHDSENKSSECKSLGYKFIDLIEEFLSSVDAVSICTPDIYHKDCFTQVFNSGIPSLIEKPLSSSIEDCRLIVEIVRGNPDYRCMVGQIERFNPVIIALRNIIEGEKIENINFIRYGPIPPVNILSGVSLDLGVHDVDLACYLLNASPKESSSFSFYYGEGNAEQKSTIELLFDSDVVVGIDLSYRSKVRARFINITTDKNHYVVNLATQKIGKVEEFNGSYSSYDDLIKKSSNIVDVVVEPGEPLKNELNSFLDYVDGKITSSPVPIEDGMRAVEIVLDSINRGRKIRIDQ